MAESSHPHGSPPLSAPDLKSDKLPLHAGRPARVSPRDVTAADSPMFSGTEADTLREITRLYLKALEAQRARDRLLAVAAHELRHPLHLMRMALARHFPDTRDPSRQSIEAYINRMVRLVDDLTDFVRTERDELEIQREWIDVGRLVADIVDQYRSTFAARGVSLTMAEGSSGLWVSADGQRLQQVFSNLLDNALKFTGASGAVTVAVTVHGDAIQVRVRDTGRGLKREIQPRALELSADLTGPHAVGIGLSVACRIVELHGGSIVLKSDGPGRGAEAIVTLPRLEEPDGAKFQGS